MNIRSVVGLGACSLVAVHALTGCADVDQLSQPDLRQFSTLTVAYGYPGRSADPCDDTLPQVDGVAQDQEWREATPLFLRMSGENGNGGGEFNVEMRAVWTDEGRFGTGGTNRIYFLLRFPDDDQNVNADLLAYIRPRQADEFCTDEFGVPTVVNVLPSPSNLPILPTPSAPFGYCRSDPPVFDVVDRTCDPVILEPDSWTRINPGGLEDQIVLMLTEVDPAAGELGLRDLNRQVLGIIGPETPAGASLSWGGGSVVDLWVWRATRTNIHPVPQYPRWSQIDPSTGIPEFFFSTFINTCGFAEDLWVTSGGILSNDGGSTDLKPFRKNFVGRDPVPDNLTECPPPGREPDPELLANVNGGVPASLGMWWPKSSPFILCDTLACTRIAAGKWSVRPEGDLDFVTGWGVQVPTGSARDVRAKAFHEITAEKQFGVWTAEFMRDMDTGSSDDVTIVAMDGTEPVPTGRYRMVVGIMDASGAVGSGSTEILLEFEPPRPFVGVINRCQ